jgi:predicted nucleic acid-binding protein
MTVLLVRRDRNTAIRVGQLLLEAEELEFVPCSDLFPDTMRAFAAQRKTRLSFTDSAIAVIARTRAAGRVLTFDAEFRKIPGLHPDPRTMNPTASL